jgi:hypothetical protein
MLKGGASAEFNLDSEPVTEGELINQIKQLNAF